MFKNWKSLIAPVLAAVIAATAANGALWQWSKTAATNATADATINWSEGQSPSSVNDSARAMMARMAEYRDDISGALTTGGTSTAYTVTTNQGLAATPNDGQLLAFIVHATNGASPTLTSDGGTAFPIQSSSGAAVASGVLVAGSPYTATFKTGSSSWILRDFFTNPNLIPVGAVIAYSGLTAPNSNFVLAFGQCVSRTTYAVYFAIVGSTYGVCDGSTTFGVPDLRGRLVAGLDAMGGSSALRITTAGSNCDGAAIGRACGSQNITQTVAQLPSHDHTYSQTTNTSGSHNHSVSGTTGGQSATHTHDYTIAANRTGSFQVGSGGFITGAWIGGDATATSAGASVGHDHTFSANTSTDGLHAHSFSGTTAGSGGGAAMPLLPPILMISYLVRII